MSPTTETVFSAIGVTLTFLLVGWNFSRLYRFQRDYRFTGSFPGTRYECVVGGLDPDQGRLSIVGADASGIYLLSHPRSDRFVGGFRGGYRVFKKNLMIPWHDVTSRAGRVLLKDCMFFEMPSRRIYLFVPKDVGEKLLRDAGRDIPV